VYGLYSSIISMLIYPIFGTSPELAVGPTALMSLLTAGVMTQLNVEDGPEGDARKLEIALRLAFLMGAVQLLMGLFNAGVLVRFLSHPMLRLVAFVTSGQLAVSLSLASILLQWFHWGRCYYHCIQPTWQATEVESGKDQPCL
jgi:SulP family sulfate permease